jgi:hypothetical protein
MYTSVRRQKGTKKGSFRTGKRRVQRQVGIIKPGHHKGRRGEYDGPDISLETLNGDVPSKPLELVLTLKGAGWFEGETAVPTGDGSSPAQIKEWSRLMKDSRGEL